MLRIEPQASGRRPLIRVAGAPVEAWIEHRPRRQGSTDWSLWYTHRGRRAQGKCQLRLEIESQLRSWLLRRYHAPLATLSFDELCLIADGKAGKVKRIYVQGSHPSGRGWTHRPTLPYQVDQ